MSDLEVREIDPSEYGLWDDLVKSSPHGTIFHTSDWLIICRDVLDEDLKIYGCFKNDELVGGCSLFIRNIKGILKIASSTSKLTPYGGLVIKAFPNAKERIRVQETHKIMNSLREFLCDQNFDSMCITLSPNFLDVRPFTWNGWKSAVFYAYYVDLQSNIDENISKNIKRDIRKAREAKINTKRFDDYKIFYDLFSMTFKRQNLKPPVPIEFFRRVFEFIESKKIGYMLVSETETSEVVAAHIRLYDKDKLCAWSAASNPDFRKAGSNTLLYYDEFKKLQGQKYSYMNMMAANTPRFTNFITGFNPKLVPYYSISWNTKKDVVLRRLCNVMK
ncbi:GNAT family N-acetyltransferase [Methanococcoides sp. LMO-2]|uniref:GNAT family N-acetyltransferase n=1 Tax=Methanococcoides cohabitans TaxID=3136559 RepID=A0ABU9KPW3_9EURY